jgi:hypothetical protein
MQLEWARLSSERTLILAPLSVARQTVREAVKLGIDAAYVRSDDAVEGPGVWVTNYEMVDKFDHSQWGAVVLDESSILKNADGALRRRLSTLLAQVPYRLACTATPAPNDVAELCNHAEFLGILPRNEMLAAYFVHDDDGWRMKNHAIDPMHQWMAQWACAIRKPSDIGGTDLGYDLPPLPSTRRRSVSTSPPTGSCSLPTSADRRPVEDPPSDAGRQGRTGRRPRQRHR